MGTGTYYLGLHMVEEFLDVFLEVLPRLPADTDIELFIDLIPGAQPISVSP